MKKKLLTAVLLIIGIGAYAQIDTIVSTVPSNKNVVLEEYTGINCGYCPDGHRIANQIAAANPGRVFLINIHQGGYAANTYTTQWGNSLASQYGINSYPTGTVNRGASAMGRDQFASASNTILNSASPVNIAAEGTLDWETNELTLHVQLYYTDNSAATTNMLNVAVLQNNILGPQSGMSSNPTQVVGNQYNHMHMLRDFITGQWGVTVPVTTQGTLFDTTFTYVVPQQLGSPNPVATMIDNMTFVVFVAEGHKTILTGTEAEITHIKPDIFARINEMTTEEVLACDGLIGSSVKVKNLGVGEISSLEFNYNVAGSDTTYNWTGVILPDEELNIELPEMEIDVNTEVTCQVNIVSINDSVQVAYPAKSATIKKNVYDVTTTMTLLLTCDRYGSETSWKIFNENGDVVSMGGPYSDLSSNGTKLHTINIVLPGPGCYRFEIYDAYGDGINSGYGAGNFKFYDENFSVILTNNGKFGSMARYFFHVSGVDVEEMEARNINVYPNPANSMLNIECENLQMVEIYNLQGQLVKSQAGDATAISVSDLANGLYMVRIQTAEGIYTQKIVKE